MSNAANLNTLPQSVIAPDAPISTEPQTPVQETPVTVPVEPKAPEKNISTERFLHLQKKEAALVKERESFKRQMEEFKAQQAEYDKYRKAYEMVNEIAELQKTDEVAAMRKAGFSDNAIINLMAQAEDNSTPEEKAVKMAKTEIDKFRAEQAAIQEAAEKRAAEERKVNEEKTIAQFKTNIGNMINTDADKLEYCKFYGEAATELIYETISSILQDSGEMIDVKEAAQLVEDYYEEQDKAMNTLKKRSSYWSKRSTPPTPPQPVQKAEVSTQQPKNAPKRVESKQFIDNRVPTKTLTNKMTATMASTVDNAISPAENKQRVLEKYMSMMKK